MSKRDHELPPTDVEKKTIMHYICNRHLVAAQAILWIAIYGTPFDPHFQTTLKPLNPNFLKDRFLANIR